MGLVIAPLSIKDISVNMIEYTASMSFIVAPFSFIPRSIRPSLLAKTMTEAIKPLTTVNCAIFKSILTFFTL